jgi:hypothetical protein
VYRFGTTMVLTGNTLTAGLAGGGGSSPGNAGVAGVAAMSN